MRTHRKVTGGGGSGRLTVSGPYFVDAQGQIVIRRSVTGFCLPKRYATGRADDARAYLDWVAASGFNEVRVFTQVNWDGVHAGVESGWAYDEAACHQMLTDAAARGLRCELVAHTWPMGTSDAIAHLWAVDALCGRHENALLEVWNEPQQNGGLDLLSAVLASYQPDTPGWASGWYEPTPYPCGQAVTYHSPRKDAWARCFKDAWEFHEGSGPSQSFSPPFTGAVMLDEPPQVEQTIRDQGAASAADDWQAYGAGAAFFAAGATMHSNPTLQQATVPTDPAVLQCVAAFIAGFADVPVQRYHNYNRGEPPTPSDEGSRRYWRWDDAGAQYEITVRPYSFRRL